MIYRQLTETEYADLAARILYEDNHILAVNKRAGEIVQGDKTGDEPLGEKYKAFLAMRDHKPGQVFIGIPHRLGRPVAGVTLLAKTSKALERLSALFRDGGIHKTYWALVCRRPDPAEGLLEDWLWRNESLNKSFVCAPGRKDAKLARLRYRLLQPTERYWLVEVELLTGRHHQIRCQLAHMGCCIKGDLKYGAPRSNPDGSISLLARNIRFEHPVRHVPMEICASLPSDGKGWPTVVPDPGIPYSGDATPSSCSSETV